MIKIRNAVQEDLPLIHECLVDSWVQHARHEPALLDEERMRRSDIEGYYKKALEDTDKSIVLVAEVDEVFAGFQRADIQEIPNFFKYNTILYLDDAYVLPRFRRMGIATQLIIEVEKIAKARGIHRLQARVYAFNTQTQQLLLKLGYSSPHATWDKVIE